jgi:hypothetical protein
MTLSLGTCILAPLIPRAFVLLMTKNTFPLAAWETTRAPQTRSFPNTTRPNRDDKN